MTKGTIVAVVCHECHAIQKATRQSDLRYRIVAYGSKWHPVCEKCYADRRSDSNGGTR